MVPSMNREQRGPNMPLTSLKSSPGQLKLGRKSATPLSVTKSCVLDGGLVVPGECPPPCCCGAVV